MSRYGWFTLRSLHSPRYFIGMGPVSVCVWRDWSVEITWHGFKKYRIQ